MWNAFGFRMVESHGILQLDVGAHSDIAFQVGKCFPVKLLIKWQTSSRDSTCEHSSLHPTLHGLRSDLHSGPSEDSHQDKELYI